MAVQKRNVLGDEDEGSYTFRGPKCLSFGSQVKLRV